MENNQKHIVENIRSHREEIDMDSLWAGVSPHIPKEKQNRKIGFWIFGGLILLVMVVGVSWVVNTANKEEVESLIAIDKSFENSEIQGLGKNDEAIEDRFSNVEIDDKSGVNSKSDNVLNYREELNAKSYSKLTEKKLNESNNTSINGINELITSNISEVSESVNINVTVGQDGGSKIFANTEEVKENDVVDRFINGVVEQKHELEKEKIEMINIKPLLGQGLRLLEANKEVIDLDLSFPIVELVHKKRNRWNIYLLGGAAFTSRKLNAKSIELQPERDRRTAVVDVLGSWEIEGGVGYRINSKLKVMTGLNYTQIHEKAVFETDYLVDFEVKSENLINTQGGNVVKETETTTGEGIRHTEEIRYNQLRLFQIPLKVSYEFLSFEKLKVNVGAFASYSFSQKYSGTTSFSSASESYNLELDKENKFRNSGSMSYGLFLEGTTHVTRMIDLSFSLGYRQTNNINTEIYLIDQKYNSLSFTSGISRRF